MKKNRVRLTESDLHRVIKESVKKVLKESKNYGITLTDTLKWVESKKPNMSPQEQHKFAMNILKKKQHIFLCNYKLLRKYGDLSSIDKVHIPLLLLENVDFYRFGRI